MAKYAIGLDGGGTKTELAMLSAAGETLYIGRLGALNPVSYPQSPAMIASELAHFVDEDCLAICAACAGVGDKKMAAAVQQALGSIFGGQIFTRTDGENSLYTAFGSQSGIAIISGTGSIGYGQNGAATARCGGRGHVFDDAGSAYAMGRDILAAVIRAHDGRAQATALSELLFEHCQTDDIAAITARYTDPHCPKSEIAALSTLIELAGGDAAAQGIERRAAEELSLTALALARRLDLAAPSVALMGGVFLHKPRLSALTAEAIRAALPGARCSLCDKSPAIGAAEYALERSSS